MYVTFTFVPVDQEILAHLFLFLKQIITGKDKKKFSACNAVTSRKLTKKLNKSDGQVCHILAIEKEPHQKDKSKRQYNKKSIRLFERVTSTMKD